MSFPLPFLLPGRLRFQAHASCHTTVRQVSSPKARSLPMAPTCRRCARSFGSAKALQDHLRDSPAHEGDPQCRGCARKFQTASALQQHLQHKPAHAPSANQSTLMPVIESFDIRPSLHSDVLRLLQQYGLSFDFCPDDDDASSVEERDTFVMGRFTCTGRTCRGRVWASGKIPTTIRQYPDSSYNARVYFQRCKACNSVSRPRLDESYAERVSWRLAKWAGLDPPTPPHSGSTTRPHEREFCEGCRLGHCEEGRLWA